MNNYIKREKKLVHYAELLNTKMDNCVKYGKELKHIRDLYNDMKNCFGWVLSCNNPKCINFEKKIF